MKPITQHFLACVTLSVLFEFTGYHGSAMLMLLAAFFIYVGKVIVDHFKSCD